MSSPTALPAAPPLQAMEAAGYHAEHYGQPLDEEAAAAAAAAVAAAAAEHMHHQAAAMEGHAVRRGLDEARWPGTGGLEWLAGAEGCGKGGLLLD